MAKVHQAALGKDGGYRLDKKTGLMVAGAKLKLANELHALVVGVTAAAAKITAERQANKLARVA